MVQCYYNFSIVAVRSRSKKIVPVAWCSSRSWLVPVPMPRRDICCFSSSFFKFRSCSHTLHVWAWSGWKHSRAHAQLSLFYLLSTLWLKSCDKFDQASRWLNSNLIISGAGGLGTRLTPPSVSLPPTSLQSTPKILILQKKIAPNTTTQWNFTHKTVYVSFMPGPPSLFLVSAHTTHRLLLEATGRWRSVESIHCGNVEEENDDVTLEEENGNDDVVLSDFDEA